MKVARALFVGGYRVTNACLSLQFDHYIDNIDETYMITNVGEGFPERFFPKYTDTSNFTYVYDNKLDELYPTIRNWLIPGDPRNSWLYQQALKLASLDYIDADVILIQDPDTFCINPYSILIDGKPNYLVNDDVHSYEYYETLKNLGFERQTEHSFVSELMPIFKEDWLKLKHEIESRNNCNVFDAIINNVPATPLKWFSEYEFLGNWVMTQRDVILTDQKRYEYEDINDIDKCNKEDFNCVCELGPKDPNLILDHDEEVITNFDEIMKKMEKFL